jgi:hypothetical protein
MILTSRGKEKMEPPYVGCYDNNEICGPQIEDDTKTLSLMVP